MRVLIHPGFHKTGTSSLQRSIQAHRDVLRPRLRVLLTDDIRKAIQIARIYSVRKNETSLAAFSDAFSEVAKTIDSKDPRPLLISAEALVGHIPGRKNVEAYDAAPALLEVVARTMRRRVGQAAEITIWFTTRNAEDWKRSAYWQNLRSTRITEDYEVYRSKLERAARLDEIVSMTRSRLERQAEVASSPIEVCGGLPAGPLSAALDLLNVSGVDLVSVPAQNVQAPEVVEYLLALNRSSLDDQTVSDAKRKLLREHRKLAQRSKR